MCSSQSSSWPVVLASVCVRMSQRCGLSVRYMRPAKLSHWTFTLWLQSTLYTAERKKERERERKKKRGGRSCGNGLRKVSTIYDGGGQLANKERERERQQTWLAGQVYRVRRGPSTIVSSTTKDAKQTALEGLTNPTRPQPGGSSSRSK